VIRLPEPLAYPMNNNSLVNFHGTTQNNGPVKDTTLDLTFDDVSKVKRSVHMLQYQKDFTTGKCKTVWKDGLLSATNLPDFTNPSAFPLKTEEFYCKKVKIGEFTLTAK